MRRTSLARSIAVQSPAAEPRRVRGTVSPPARVGAAPRLDSPASARRPLLAVFLAILLAINTLGASYYSAPVEIRVRHAWHSWLRPSGYIGQAAGILAFAIFVFLWLYPLRKRFRSLAWTGSVGRWLDVHVTAALTLPLLLAIHAAWQFDGVIGLGYTAILLVCTSGVAGRYLYTRIPRARSGVELTREEVSAQRTVLVARIATSTSLEPSAVERALAAAAPTASGHGAVRSLLELVAGDLLRWRRVRRLRRYWSTLGRPGHRLSRHSLDEAVRLASREMSLAEQVRLLDATHRVFRWWHVAHRPVAISALLAVVIHLVVVLAVGATWLG
jgi:hypothetical protein